VLFFDGECEFSLFGVETKTQVLELLGKAHLEGLAVVVDFSLFGFHLTGDDGQLFDLLPCSVYQLLHVLRNFRKGPADSLHLMALMRAMDHALGANRRTLAAEAEVAHELIGVVRAGSTTSWQLGASVA